MCDLKYLILLSMWFCVNVEAYRTFNVNGVQRIFAKNLELVKIVCEDDVPLVKCGFTHSNGTKMLFSDLNHGTPQCEMEISLTYKDEGLWTCHIWSLINPNNEIIKSIEVNIVDKFSAINKDMVVKEGDDVTLSCVTTEAMIPLNHCYFMTPTRELLHVNDNTTIENVLMNRYYFPVNKSLNRGDCGITINGVSLSDSGMWYCYGWIEYQIVEYTDFIRLTVKKDIIERDHTEVLYASAVDNTALIACVCGALLISLTLILIIFFWKRLDLPSNQYKDVEEENRVYDNKDISDKIFMDSVLLLK